MGVRSAPYPTLKIVCSSTVQYKARPNSSDKRRLQHSISAIFFQDLNSVLELCPWKFLDVPSILHQSNADVLGERKFCTELL